MADQSKGQNLWKIEVGSYRFNTEVMFAALQDDKTANQKFSPDSHML